MPDLPCLESGLMEVGEIWYGPHAIVTLMNVFATDTIKIHIDDRYGYTRDMTVIEGGIYDFYGASYPFSLEVIVVFMGYDPDNYRAEVKTCELYVEPVPPAEEEPPDDLLGLLGYIKDKIIATFAAITGLIASVLNIDGIVTGIRDAATSFRTFVTEKFSVLNYELDVLDGTLDALYISIIDSIGQQLLLYKTDIIDAIKEISVLDPTEIIEQIKDEIAQLGTTISDQIITKLWDYIEDHIFEKE